MTTLYRPVLIESAEQAEALPEGTAATSDFDFVRERCISGWTGGDGQKLYRHAAMVGWTALVPIEAEEEHVAPDAITYTRYVTAWEAA